MLITDGPEGPTENDRPVFTFVFAKWYKAAIADSGFECRLQSIKPNGASDTVRNWTPCSSPYYGLGSLMEGQFQFSVRSATEGGRKSSATAAVKRFLVRMRMSSSKYFALATLGEQPWPAAAKPLGRQPLQVTGSPCLFCRACRALFYCMLNFSFLVFPATPSLGPLLPLPTPQQFSGIISTRLYFAAATPNVQVDTTSPVIDMLSAPPFLQTGSISSFEFKSSEIGTLFFCSLLVGPQNECHDLSVLE